MLGHRSFLWFAVLCASCAAPPHDVQAPAPAASAAASAETAPAATAETAPAASAETAPAATAETAPAASAETAPAATAETVVAGSHTVTTHESRSPQETAASTQACAGGALTDCHAAALDAYYAPPSPKSDARALA